MSNLAVALLATLALATVSNGQDGTAEIETFPVSPDAALKTDYNNKAKWSRNPNGSIDLKLYQNYIITKYLETQRLLESVCSVHEVNGCQPYRMRATEDLKKFFKALGKAIKYFDGYLLQARQNRKNKTHRPRHATTKKVVVVEPKTTTTKPTTKTKPHKRGTGKPYKPKTTKNTFITTLPPTTTTTPKPPVRIAITVKRN